MALETTTNPIASAFDEGFAPLDDASVAERLANEYSEHGMNPYHAYSNNDDPLADFGGTEVFR